MANLDADERILATVEGAGGIFQKIRNPGKKVQGIPDIENITRRKTRRSLQIILDNNHLGSDGWRN